MSREVNKKRNLHRASETRYARSIRMKKAGDASQKDQSGFTLIELMICVAIVAMLASIAIPQFQRYVLQAKEAEAKINLNGIKSALQTKYTTSGFNYSEINYCPWLPITGLKKPWGGVSCHSVVESFDPESWITFGNIGFVPSGDVYYHYGCWSMPPAWGGPNDAVICSAGSDLDGDSNGNFCSTKLSLWNIAWRSSENGGQVIGPMACTMLDSDVVPWGTIWKQYPEAY